MNRALNTCSECGGPLQDPQRGSRCASCVARSASASAPSGGRQPMAAGFGDHAEFEERTDDPHTIPAIPGSALEPAAPFAFSVGKRRKRARPVGGPHPGTGAADDGADDLSDELPSDSPEPAIDRAAHEIDAPLPPRALRQGGQASQPQPQPQPQPAPTPAAQQPPPPSSQPQAAPQRPSTLQAALSASARPKSFTPARPADPAPATPGPAPMSARAPSPTALASPPSTAAPAPRAAPAAAAPGDGDAPGEPVGEDRWLSARSVAFGLVTAGWTAMSSVWFVLGTFVYLTGGSGLFLIVAAAVLHAWVALALGYVAMALLVNRTWVRLEARGLELVNGPVPWPGRRFEVRALERVDVVPAATGARVGMLDVVLVVHGHAPIAVARSLDASAARAAQARWTARLGEVEPSSART